MLNEERSTEILLELIRASGGNIDNVAQVYAEVMDAHAEQFPAPVVVEIKKRRRRKGGGNPKSQGWPAGVSKTEYRAWREEQVAKGRTEGLNPRTYKAERDAVLA